MSRAMWVVVGVIGVIVLVLLYIWLAKPTLVLPPITVALGESSPVNALKRQLNINELGLKVRTDGKAYVVSDGKDLAQINYTPATLSNALRIAEKVAVPPNTSRTLRIVPGIFPNLTTNALLTGLAIYYFLPVETTVRFN